MESNHSRNSEALDAGFEMTLVKQNSPIATWWECEEIKKTKQHKWTQKVQPEAIIEVNKKLFPAILPTSKMIELFLWMSPTEAVFPVLSDIGFNFSKDRPEIFYSPTKERLVSYLEFLKKENPALSGLRLHEADQILSPDQFLELMLDDVLICGDWPENIHDLYFHIAPMLTNISLDPQNYPRFKQDQRKIIKGYLEELQKAEKSKPKFLEDLNSSLITNEGSEIDIAQWERIKRVIKYSLSAYLDIYSSRYFKDKFPETKELKEDFLGILDYIIIDDSRWKDSWTKELDFKQTEQQLVSQDPNTKLIIRYLYTRAGLD